VFGEDLDRVGRQEIVGEPVHVNQALPICPCHVSGLRFRSRSRVRLVIGCFGVVVIRAVRQHGLLSRDRGYAVGQIRIR
jgi:hypothetical protein